MSRSKSYAIAAALIVGGSALLAGVWIQFIGGAEGAISARADHEERKSGSSPPREALEKPKRSVPRVDASLAAQLPLRPTSAGSITGWISIEGGSGVPDAPVELSLRHGPRRLELGTAVTDANGHYALELDLAAAMALLEHRVRTPRARAHEPLSLRARVNAVGFGPAQASTRIGGDAPRHIRLDLVLERGCGVRGTVFHRGTPCVGARVHLFDEHWVPRAVDTTDERGRYVLPLSDAGLFHLHARLEGLGAAGTSGYSLGAALPYLSIDLDIDGLSTIYAHVRMFDGTPIAGLRVEALHAALYTEELAGGPAVALPSLARAEETGGLAASEMRTDAKGRVVFDGLQSAAFNLRMPGLRVPGLEPFGPFEPSGIEQELVIDAHLLVVRIEPPPDRPRSAPYDAPTIEILFSPDPQRGPEGWRPAVLTVVPSTDPVASFLVEPETRWRVLARTLEHTAAGEVRIFAGRHITRLELELGDWDEEVSRAIELASTSEPSGLELTALDERGEALPELQLTVWSAGERTRPLLDQHAFGPEEPLPQLPPGRYDLRVEVLGEAAEWAVQPAIREGVELISGEATRVEFDIRSGGRLELRLQQVFVPRGFEHSSAVAVTLRDARTGAILLRPDFQLATDGEWLGELYPGESGKSAPLEPGRYTVAFESDWFSPPSKSVVIRAYQRSEVAPLLVSQHLDVAEDDSPAPIAPRDLGDSE